MSHYDDVALLDQVHTILRTTNDEPGPDEIGFTLAGALIIGLYVAPDGQAAGTWHRALGGMDVFRQEGVLNDRLRCLLADMDTTLGEDG